MEIDQDLKNRQILYKGKPHAILTMGSSGSGKSTTLRTYKHFSNYYVIDYDEEMLREPELIHNQQNYIYDSGLYHKYYDEISSRVERMFNYIINGPKINLICHSVTPHPRRIQRLVDAGYHVSILYKRVDDETALRNRATRLKETALYTKVEFVTQADVDKLQSYLETLRPRIYITDIDRWVAKQNSK